MNHNIVESISTGGVFPESPRDTDPLQPSHLTEEPEVSDSLLPYGRRLALALSSALSFEDSELRQLCGRLRNGEVTTESLKQMNCLLRQGAEASLSVQGRQLLDETLRRLAQVQPALREHTAPMLPMTPPAVAALQMVIPPAMSRVEPAQAQRALQQVMGDSHIPLASMVQMPLDGLLLQAANLSIKTFSDTAGVITRSMQINTEAREKLTDKRIDDYRQQLEKAMQQQEKAQKGGLFGAILNPIINAVKWVIDKVIAVVDAIVPGVKAAVEGLMSFIGKNISELALIASVITALLCPMTLGLAVGLVATSVASGFSVAKKALGDKAPEWLQITDQVGSMISGLVVMGGAMSLAGRMFGQLSGKLSVAMKGVLENAALWGGRIQAGTGFTNGIAQSVLGMQQTQLQKEVAQLDNRLAWNDIEADWLKAAQQSAAKGLEQLFDKSAAVSQGAADTIAASGSLRGKIAGSLA
ncbi:type III secretion system translocon subunit SctE [Serratia quinivorans]|uniref:type III secretion system translocon subunit SctE n=1 Tax=Serratia quinivorans TaxID=137545 RepID=UPI0021784A49|nr:type III secretion system translocon subunit SctE [Serratia quinivorans]CAI1010565.1 Secretion system effector C [Serratia quinivorans]CAI1810989.1 Secretion system effector C [Serratia quinivorans]